MSGHDHDSRRQDSRTHIPSGLPPRAIIARMAHLIGMNLNEAPRRGETELMFQARIACNIARLALRIRDETMVMCGATRGSWRMDHEVARFLKDAFDVSHNPQPEALPTPFSPVTSAPSPNTISQGRHP
jgi:hypothetical protein